MKIKVTQKNIDEGVQFEPGQCAIAKAFRDLGVKVSVNPRFIRRLNKYGHITSKTEFELPSSATSFVLAFDENKKNVKPFEFEISDELFVKTKNPAPIWEPAT